MGRPILLIRLEGVLQSWGVRARWDIRDTQREPTKSAVIGILGCALGLPKYDSRLRTELDAGLRMGLRVEHPGRVMVDYQTITDYLPTAAGTYRHSGTRTARSLKGLLDNPDAVPATITSPRSYLQDAAFLVLLEEKEADGGLLVRCHDALLDPKWAVFLGRKSCIASRPLLEALTEKYADLEDAVSRHPWSWDGVPENFEHPAHLTAYLETENESLDDEILIRQDVTLVSPARQYGYRRVRRLSVPYPENGSS